MKQETADISIVVCSKDRRVKLKRLVDHLRAAIDSETGEIVVVEETDQPTSLEGVVYIQHESAGRGIPFARNLGLLHARGKIVVFLDDDCMVDDEWILILLEPFKDQNVVGVQGGVACPKEKTTLVGWCETLLGFPGGGLLRIFESAGKAARTREVSTLNCAYRKWVLDEIGGFDERLRLGCEDYLLAKQACAYGECRFVPEAIALHDTRGNLPDIWNWFVRRGKAEIDLLRTGKQRDLSWAVMIRRSLSTKILGLAVVAAGSGKLGVVCAVSLLLYMLLQYRRYFDVWRFSGCAFRVLLVLPIVKMVMDAAADWGRLARVLQHARNI